tara:strand:- start:17876 stop:19069 length:1194 start_codon:yes stop_codon:yes gene_type:complete
MLSGKRIILGVTGGIAAYKAVFLLREFQKAGAEVRVVMTPAATRFVGIETFTSLTRYDVAVDVFSGDQPGQSWTKHVHMGEWADLYVIAPCTANTLAKIVQGASDNMLTTTVLTARCPILICPTMDGEMYESPAVSENLDKVRKMGYYIQEPESGYLASGLEAKGRLPEPETILQRADTIIKEHAIQGPLTGKKVVVTAGPTREYIDPVRFISNPSSGKMGIAMAEAARALGGDVLLLHGPISIQIPERIQSIPFVSAEELFGLMKTHVDANVVIMAAAVSDFSAEEKTDKKVKKDQASLSLKLKRTPDTLQWLGENKKKGQLLIGFAMETEDLIQNAKSKLEKKNLDWICANSIQDEDSGFDSDTNKITLLGKNSEEYFEGTKEKIAIEILEKIFP